MQRVVWWAQRLAGAVFVVLGIYCTLKYLLRIV
jgi:hypothetical protein